MKRYTQEMVDQALEQVAADGHIERHTAIVLAAEVRALRVENERRWNAATQELDRLNALVKQYADTFMRVELRAEKWAGSSRKWNGLGCASDVRVALRGEP